MYCLLIEATKDAEGNPIYRVANCHPNLDKGIICGPITQETYVYSCEEVDRCSNGRAIVKCQIGEER